MSTMIDLAKTGDLKDGTMKAVSVNGQEIALAKVDGTFYAIENACPHMKARLSEGTLEGYTVTCPKHGSQFDIRTGENIRWLKGTGVVATLAKIVKPPHPVRSFKTEVQGDDVRITIE